MPRGPWPLRLAPCAGAGRRGLGGPEQQRRGRQGVGLAPAHRLGLGARGALGEPALTQRLPGRAFPPPSGRGRSVEGPQPVAALHTDLRGQGGAGGLLRRQASGRTPAGCSARPTRLAPRPGARLAQQGPAQGAQGAGGRPGPPAECASGWQPAPAGSRCVDGREPGASPARGTASPWFRPAGGPPGPCASAGGTRAGPRPRSPGRATPGPGPIASPAAPARHPQPGRASDLRHTA